jgi:hypothetical protein
MEVVAARVRAVAVEVDADQAAVPAAGAAGAQVGERREVGLLDGRGRHGMPGLPRDGTAVRAPVVSGGGTLQGEVDPERRN